MSLPAPTKVLVVQASRVSSSLRVHGGQSWITVVAPHTRAWKPPLPLGRKTPHNSIGELVVLILRLLRLCGEIRGHLWVQFGLTSPRWYLQLSVSNASWTNSMSFGTGSPSVLGVRRPATAKVFGSNPNRPYTARESHSATVFAPFAPNKRTMPLEARQLRQGACLLRQYTPPQWPLPLSPP
jgi:hypothetical protein